VDPEAERLLKVFRQANTRANAGMPNQAKYMAVSIVIDLIRLRCQACYHKLEEKRTDKLNL
jgi:hypothetical protein